MSKSAKPKSAKAKSAAQAPLIPPSPRKSGEREKNKPRVYQLKVTLMWVRPAIWRRLLVPGSISLASLHDILQTAMGWGGGHMHQFVAPGGVYYGVPQRDSEFDDLDTKDEDRFRLDQVLRREKDSIVYEYDFGDGWEHKIVLEKILAPAAGVAVPSCIGGKRACPPDDCGGVPGYANFLAAIGDATHPEHEDMVEWIGGAFDPERFDAQRINAVLAASARRARRRG